MCVFVCMQSVWGALCGWNLYHSFCGSRVWGVKPHRVTATPLPVQWPWQWQHSDVGPDNSNGDRSQGGHKRHVNYSSDVYLLEKSCLQRFDCGRKERLRYKKKKKLHCKKNCASFRLWVSYGAERGMEGRKKEKSTHQMDKGNKGNLKCINIPLVHIKANVPNFILIFKIMVVCV